MAPRYMCVCVQTRLRIRYTHARTQARKPRAHTHTHTNTHTRSQQQHSTVGACAPVSIYQERRRKSISWQPSPSSDLHDDVNLVTLFILGFGAVAALALDKPQHPIHSLLTYSGFVYILLDSIWICSMPKIVKSPGMVGAHHFATLLVLLDPLLTPTHRVYTSACLLVEINTLLLLLRRKLSYAYVVEAPFIITWVLLRNIWYPLLLGYFMLCFKPDYFAPLLPASLQWLVHFRQQLEAPAPAPMMFAVCESPRTRVHTHARSHATVRARARARARAHILAMFDSVGLLNTKREMNF